MRTSSVAVIGVVLACVGCQPSPSLEEQCVRAKQAQADAFRIFNRSDCEKVCLETQKEVIDAAYKWSEKVCK
jgi:hypothetical protein